MREEAPQAEAQEVRLSVSDKEILQKKDFAQMSAAEIAAGHPRHRRHETAARPNCVPAAISPMRGACVSTCGGRCASLRTGGEIIDIRKLGRIDKPAPIVALLDISGSISEYTRLFLHFLHAITDARKRVSVFLFGTRLTNVTRALRARDPMRRWRAARRRSRTGRRHPHRHVAARLQQLWGGACSARAPSCC